MQKVKETNKKKQSKNKKKKTSRYVAPKALLCFIFELDFNVLQIVVIMQ